MTSYELIWKLIVLLLLSNNSNQDQDIYYMSNYFLKFAINKKYYIKFFIIKNNFYKLKLKNGKTLIAIKV